jgi:Tol biopolymer transport system component
MHDPRRGQGQVPVALTVVLVLLLIAASCTSGGGSSSSAKGSSTTPPTSESGSSAPTIGLGILRGKLLFTRAGGKFGDETIFTAAADGTHERRVSGFGATCCPGWSSDGRYMLMAASAPDGRITTGIADPDGSHLRRIPLPSGTLNLGCSQALSLRTGRLACEGWSDTKPSLRGIYTVRASDGGDLVRLTTSSEMQDTLVMGFSPDGSRVFFFRSVEGFPSIGDQLGGSLFVVNADGKGLHQVTPPGKPVEIVGNAGGRLSRDGRWIVFTSFGVIWKIRPDGSGLTRVFRHPQGRLAITPTWSPDGRYILFGLDPPGSLATVDIAPANGLYIIRADGTDLTPLIVSDDWKRNPDWVAP